MAQRVKRSGNDGGRTRARAALVAIAVLGVTAAAGAQLTTEATVVKEEPTPPFGPAATLGRLGEAQLAADFDGDGFDDLAVGRAGADAGRVYVVRGGASGLTYAQTLTQFATSEFGASFASCDFDDDGYDDLVVGAPRTAADPLFAVGAVFLYLGGPTGLTAVQSITRADLGLGLASGDFFGRSLAAGDFDGDEACDLAIGTPGADQTGVPGTPLADVGEVTVVWGLGNGLLDTGGTLSFQEANVPSTEAADSAAFDDFGAPLAAAPAPGGDLLLVGVPSKDAGGSANAGRVWIVRFDGRSLDSSTRLDYADFGVLGSAQAFTRLGASLAAGRFVGNGLQLQIAVGIPGYAVSTGQTSGAVLVVSFADALGGGFFSAQRLDQTIAEFGSSPEDGESFGESLAAADVDGDGWDDLAIGVVNDEHVSMTKGISPPRYGSVHVVYGGADAFVSAQTVDEADAGGTPEDDDFGASLATGDFFGRGAASLAIGAPKKNGVLVRGSNPEDDHGIVYVFATTEAATPVQQAVRTGAPLPGIGGEEVSALSDPAMSDFGAGGFRGVWASGESFVAVGGAIVFEDSDVACATGQSVERGFALAASATFGHLDRTGSGCPEPAGDFDALITSGGVLADETDPVPGGGLVGNPEQLVSTGEGRLYVLGRDGADERILRTAPGFATPLETVRATGQAEDGLTLKSVDRFDVSPGGAHLLYSGVLGNVADHEYLVLDGVRIVPVNTSFPGDPSIVTLGPLAVADDGRFLFAAGLDDGSERLYLADPTGVLARVGDAPVLGVPSLSGVSLEGLEPLSLSWGAEGRAVHLWGELVPDGSPSVPVARGRVLFGMCRGELEQSTPLLQVGQTLRSSPSEAPATLVEIHSVNSREGLELGAEGELFIGVALERGADTFDAILEIVLDCGIFADGFESGDTSAWQ